MSKDYQVYLLHILDSINHIEHFTKGIGKKRFLKSKLVGLIGSFICRPVGRVARQGAVRNPSGATAERVGLFPGARCLTNDVIKALISEMLAHQQVSVAA